ncbi:HAMP domain protein, partial [Leptospira interrogans serovar Bataviae str. HAI135]
IPPGEFSVSVHITRENKRSSALKYKIKYEPGAENLTQIKAVPYSEEERKKAISSFPIDAIEIDHLENTQKLKEFSVSGEPTTTLNENSSESNHVSSESKPEFSTTQTETFSENAQTSENVSPQIENKPTEEIQLKSQTESISNIEPTSSKVDKNTLDETKTKPTTVQELSTSQVKSKFPLQIKLMAVISVLMTFTVSTIIFFASSAFRDDSEVRVLQNNLNLVNILGLKIKTDIKEILTNGKQMVGALVQGKEGISFADIFFQNDPDFIYAGLFQMEGNIPSVVNEFFNEPYLSELKVSTKEISDLVGNRPGLIQKSVLTGGRMENLSAEFKEPILAIAIPSSGSNSKVLVLVLRLEKFLNAFQKQDISEIFLVNGEGGLIAHSDPKLLQSNTNFMNLPIVESMVKSSENTKQIEYKDKEGNAWFGSYQKLGFGGAAVVSIVPENKAFEAVYKIQKTNLLIMGIALCLALIIVFFFAKTITKPVLNLLRATTEIAQGNFKIKISSITNDEVGLLTDYFVDMSKGLEEREKVKDALGRFVNKEIAEMVLK